MHFKNVIIKLTHLQNGNNGIQYKFKKYHVHDEEKLSKS
jgi:hypothetical protein